MSSSSSSSLLNTRAVARLIALAIILVPMFACAYDYEAESETRRTVREDESCPGTDGVALAEHAEEAELTTQNLKTQTPLCWYRVDVEPGSSGKCSASFAPFETLADVRKRTVKAYEPNASFFAPAVQGRGELMCTKEGPVIVWQLQEEGKACAEIPDTTSWDDDVRDFWSKGMHVKELVGTDQRSTHRICSYELTTEHHKPSCTSSAYWL